MGDRIGIGIIGFGFMGRTHAGAYRWAAHHGGCGPAEVLCVADRRGSSAFESSGGNLGDAAHGLDADRTRVVTDHRVLLDDPAIDLVSICTPTDTHVDLAIEALEAGKHVLVEKPVAVTSDDAMRLVEASKQSDRVCMPAMCMRFWPGWSQLISTVHARTLGRTLAASFTRTGAPPAWSAFYADESKSGGAMLDLHIHDVDFILRCFGAPDAVTSVGSASHVSTQYRFRDGPGLVVAEGGWLRSSATPFTMRFVVEFEHGVMAFDLASDPSVTVYADEDGTTPIDVSGSTGYDHQAAAMLRAVRAGRQSPVGVAEAVRGLRIVEAERDSLERGETVAVRHDGLE
ncbi:MAG: Gfo/Idh/MocA family protein [Phycisphaerales bacterium]